MRWAAAVLVLSMQVYAIPLEDLIKEAESVAVPKRVSSKELVVSSGSKRVVVKREKEKVNSKKVIVNSDREKKEVRVDRYVMDLGNRNKVKVEDMEYIGKVNGCEIYKGKGGYKIKCRGKK